MHSIRRLSAIAGLLALALVGSLTSTHGALVQSAFAASPVVGHVYVNDNSTPNKIAGFDRHTDGSLTAIPGSPFAAGGAGAGIASQGSIQFSSDGRYILAVDAGSNQISVLRVQPDGSLSLVSGSPVSSGGSNPASIAVHGNLVYVANQGGTPNLAGFTLSPDGSLQPLSNSTVTLPAGSDPTDVLFNGTGGILPAGSRSPVTAVTSSR